MAVPRRPAATIASTTIPDLLDILVKQDKLSNEQVEKVKRACKLSPGAESDVIQQLGLLSDIEIAQAVARHAGLPFLKINPLDLDLDVVTSALPAPFARKHTMCAISKHQNGITVAIANPFNLAPLRDLQQFAGLEVKLVVATRRDIEMVNKGFYDLKASLKVAETQLTEGRTSSIDVTNQEFLSGPSDEMDPTMQPVISALDNLLDHAFDDSLCAVRLRLLAYEKPRQASPLHDRKEGHGNHQGIRPGSEPTDGINTVRESSDPVKKEPGRQGQRVRVAERGEFQIVVVLASFSRGEEEALFAEENRFLGDDPAEFFPGVHAG